MTQKELGIDIGFDEKNADIRISQYEADTRTSKPELIEKFDKALNAHVLSLMNERTQYPVINMVFDLIDMEERAKVTLHPIEDNNSKYAISIDSKFFNDFLEELVLIRKELSDGTISLKNLLIGKLTGHFLVVQIQNINGVIRNSFRQYQNSISTSPYTQKKRPIKSVFSLIQI